MSGNAVAVARLALEAGVGLLRGAAEFRGFPHRDALAVADKSGRRLNSDADHRQITQATLCR